MSMTIVLRCLRLNFFLSLSPFLYTQNTDRFIASLQQILYLSSGWYLRRWYCPSGNWPLHRSAVSGWDGESLANTQIGLLSLNGIDPVMGAVASWKRRRSSSPSRDQSKDNLSQIFAVVENSFPFHRHSSNEESASHYFSRMAIPLSGMSHIQFLCLKRLQPYRFAILLCSISTIFYIPSTQPESDKVASLCPIPGSCPAVNICTYIHIPKYSLLSVWFVLISPVLNNARNLRFHLSVDKNGEFSEIWTKLHEQLVQYLGVSGETLRSTILQILLKSMLDIMSADHGSGSWAIFIPGA